MTDKRRELINALIGGLGINKDAYAIDTLKEKTELLKESQYLDFYQEVMKENSFGNGIKAVLNVIDRFKPIEDESELDLKAKELIALVYGMNQAVYQDHIKTGISFDVLLSGVKFPKLSSEDNSVLINVAPHYNLRDLIQHISCYTNSIEQHRAFKTALTRVGESLAIENKKVSGMIGRMKK